MIIHYQLKVEQNENIITTITYMTMQRNNLTALPTKLKVMSMMPNRQLNRGTAERKADKK